MSEKIFQAQVNYGWGLSLNMTGKAPAVAKRIFDTYDDALAYVNDYNDSAIEGLQLTVVADDDSKKNGVYFVEKIGTEIMTVDENGKPKGTGVAKNDGILKKVGGTETETAANYTAAVALSNSLTVGQLIKVTNEEVVDASGNSDDDDDTKITYKAGFYIVEAPGVISALGSFDNIADLEAKVDANIAGLSEDINDASEKIKEIDDRLDALDAFVELHEAISELEIEGLFKDNAGSEPEA